MTTSLIDIILIPALKDNYIFALIDKAQHCVVIIDPGDAKPALDFLERHALTLAGVLITHHHWDHTDGILDLIRQHPAPVYGPGDESIASVTHPIYDNDVITFEHFSEHFKVMSIKGHTKGHVAYLMANNLFCGDTLFCAGCGRLFEGTASDLYQSLQSISSLPDVTNIYCAHEYTINNLKFATMVEPHNQAIQRRFTTVTELRNQHQPSIPSRLIDEKNTNPFLRCDSDEIRKNVENHVGRQMRDAVDVFAELRKWKDAFVA